MFQHILVPVNFAPENQRALEIALSLVPSGQGQVSALHVIELIADTNIEEFQGFYENLMSDAQEHMNRLSALVNRDGARLTPCICYGNRLAEILRFSAEREVDLIVMNSHVVDPNGDSRGWNSISYKISWLAPCSVMLVK